MRVLFNFKYRNASYLTDKYSVNRRRPLTEINSREYSFSPFNIRPLRLWSPGLLCSYAYGLLASSAPSLSAPDQPPKPLGNSQTDAEIIINANVTITHTIIIIYTWNKSALIPLIPKLSELLLRADSVLAAHLWCPSPNLSRKCPLLLQCCPLWSILCCLWRPRRHSRHRRPQSLCRLL